ncbi:uncharacterized protein Dvir_GJ20002, isoform E [Drosophila virilis]|uniref:Uncharacterized protein, isoform E n=1 Tax=Drosophila virilis TaxID=7244 RepID=A0A0Q9W5K6_DROVI|nr:uncharacterized protein Dvir_GJ20002, isoform E [Drosophila virilis]
MAMWRKQISELVRKREMLALISDYIQLQERYVESRLRSNKRLLNYAKRIWSMRRKESS